MGPIWQVLRSNDWTSSFHALNHFDFTALRREPKPSSRWGPFHSKKEGHSGSGEV